MLCGSRKYPVKEPFVELIKGSLNTFLNAMTFPDKTCYPVASQNLRDFYNLIDVYLDAVFYPGSLRTPCSRKAGTTNLTRSTRRWLQGRGLQRDEGQLLVARRQAHRVLPALPVPGHGLRPRLSAAIHRTS